MSQLLVADSGPLIALAGVETLELLRQLYQRVVAPPAVLAEVVFAARERSGHDLLERAPWLERMREPAPLPDDVLRRLPEGFGWGEKQALAIAWHEPGSLLLLDDHQARRVAENLRLPMTGTAGVLVRAKREQLIPAVRPFLEAIRANGYHLGASILERALREAGE